MNSPSPSSWYQSLATFITPNGWPNDYLVIDIETDGFGPKTLPLQVAWLQIRDRKPVPEESGSHILDWVRGASFEFMDYLRGRIDRTREQMESKGLQYRFSIDSLSRDGIDPDTGMLALHNAIRMTANNQQMLVGYNHLYFDLPIIRTNLPANREECNLNPLLILDLGLCEKARVHTIHPWRGATILGWYGEISLRRGLGRWSLDAARTLYGLDCDASKAHEASADCYDTHLLLEAYRAIMESVQ